MADAAAREARRRKITENAEARMNRLLGIVTNREQTSEVTAQEQPQQDEQKATATHTSPYDLRNRPQKTPSPEPSSTRRSKKPAVQTTPAVDITARQQTDGQESLRQRIHASEKTSQPARTAEIQEDSSQTVEDENQPAFVQTLQGLDAETLEICKIVIFVITAFLARFLLRFGIGLFLVQSIFVPFIVLEIGIMYIHHKYLQHIQLPSAKGSLMAAALMLCGIKQELIDTYHGIMAHVAMVTVDFCLYVFSFITWNAITT